jgi:hypothetical protein
LFCLKIGIKVCAELFARRAVQSKPPPARLKIASSSRSFSRTVVETIKEVMREIWLRMKKMNPTDSATWYVAVGIIIIILAAIAVAVGRRKHQR